MPILDRPSSCVGRSRDHVKLASRYRGGATHVLDIGSTSVIFCQIFWLRSVVSRSMSPTASMTTGSWSFSA